MDGSVRGKSDFYKINRVNEAVCKTNNSEFSDFPSDIFKPMVSRTGHLEHVRRWFGLISNICETFSDWDVYVLKTEPEL